MYLFLNNFRICERDGSPVGEEAARVSLSSHRHVSPCGSWLSACCHRFSACCLLPAAPRLLFSDFHLRLSDVGWPSLVWLRERTVVANIDQCVIWEWEGKSRETWGVGFVGHQFWLVLPMLSWASSEMNPCSRIFPPRSGFKWRKSLKWSRPHLSSPSYRPYSSRAAPPQWTSVERARW